VKRKRDEEAGYYLAQAIRHNMACLEAGSIDNVQFAELQGHLWGAAEAANLKEHVLSSLEANPITWRSSTCTRPSN
jgi:hypothetical protein